MNIDEVVEVAEEDTDFDLIPGTQLNHDEAIAYLAWKMNQRGMVNHEKTEEEINEESAEDEVLKQFGM